MTEMMKTVTRFIVALAVIVVVAAIVFLFFRLVLPALKGDALGIGVEQQNNETLNILSNNLKNCLNSKESDCLCDGLPNFPASFIAGSKIRIEEENKNTTIGWIYKEKTYKNITVENLKLSTMLFPQKEEHYRSIKIIDFKTEPPELDQEGLTKKYWHGLWGKIKPRLISGKIYKKENTLFLLVSYDYKKTKEIEYSLKNIKNCE